MLPVYVCRVNLQGVFWTLKVVLFISLPFEFKLCNGRMATFLKCARYTANDSGKLVIELQGSIDIDDGSLALEAEMEHTPI